MEDTSLHMDTEDQQEHVPPETERDSGSAGTEAEISSQSTQEEEELEGEDSDTEREVDCVEAERHHAENNPETVKIHVKNEQEEDEEDYLKTEEGEVQEEGEGEAHNGGESLSPIDYVKYEISSSDGLASSFLGPRGSSGKMSCDICGLACVSLNVLLVHKRSHTGERPFHCTQCGASFTQKGNLLRHIKLHSGEKPFKCHLCSYACRRRDALSGHLRTHSVEKPYKCNYCGRSYKQRSSLEEHKERCHIYMQNKSNIERECEEARGSRVQMGTERALVLDRLASNVAKRKSSMPQKFVGEKRLCLDMSYNSNLMFSKEGELVQRGVLDPALGYLGTDSMYHLIQRAQTTAAPEMAAIVSSAFPIPLTRTELSNGHEPEQPHPCIKRQSSTTQRPSPNHSGHDSPDIDNNHHPHEEPQGHNHPLYTLGHLLVPRPRNGLPHPDTPFHPPRLYEALKPQLAVPPQEALRVVNGENELVGTYLCEHCRVLFLDYVMFTIHMGCHGFRDPFQCNVCGHHSQDRYEFSSHIARGQHRLMLK
ncbi:zinc finger protein Aiolos-like isoform X1 [Megalops cyprinoides]|uniref:zinc finger protein Aiolos-like isoform X1 n=1 Tax=Megalops cyprinoides TaxID=118141 RepID=UPI0018649887|nr:zinc finger protein Aiolos-like isoform X1 [Megalops cyprinoides]